MIVFIVMSAFVVVNLLIAVICDALQILRTAEVTMLELNMNGMDPPKEDESLIEAERDGSDVPEGEPETRRRVWEMQKMLDEMVVTQEGMARTIRHLSLALYADRKAEDGLGSIREIKSDEISNRGSNLSDDRREASADEISNRGSNVSDDRKEASADEISNRGSNVSDEKDEKRDSSKR